MGRVTAVGGTRVHAAVLGPTHAPTVVCVHGHTATSGRVARLLARRMAGGAAEPGQVGSALSRTAGQARSRTSSAPDSRAQ